MHQILQDICTALDETASNVKSSIPHSATLKETFGWQFPALTGHDLASLASRLAAQLREANPEEVEDGLLKSLDDVPRRLRLLMPDTIPNMNGNPQAVPAYVESLNVLEKALAPFISFVLVKDQNFLPAKVATKLKAINRTMERVEKENGDLTSRVAQINQAYENAAALPTTLQELEEARAALEEARAKIDKLYEEATKTTGKIEKSQSEAGLRLSSIEDAAGKAAKLIAQCEDAYKITTTKGLAAAFDKRAVRLNISIVLWVIGLLSALTLGADLGSKRIETLSRLLSDHTEWGAVLLHMVLSVLSIGGPLWFAWLATKQIGQRFRLAEDYAYKASVAKAYEGYRKEAANFDNNFAERLFGAALTRLEEPPLRLVEKETHASPAHEFINSKAFVQALKTFPDIREKAFELSKSAIDAAVAFGASKEKRKEASTEPTAEQK